MVVDSACLTGGLLYSMFFEQRFNALPCFVGDSGTSIDDFGDGGWRGVRKFGDVRQLRSLTGGTHIGLR